MPEAIKETMSTAIYDEMYAKMFINNDVAQYFRSQAELAKSRREDIADSFEKFRPGATLLLHELGIEDPTIIDRVTMWGSIKERLGFESGVKFVNDNADVTPKGQSRWVYNEDRDPSIHG